MEQSGQSSSQGFSGVVNLQLTDLIQMLCLNRSSVAICVRSGKGLGTIYVKEGEIRHAETETVQGEPAFFEMFRWKDGHFEMLPFRDTGINSLDRSWEYLLLQAMRQRDEEAARQEDQKSREVVEQEQLTVVSATERDGDDELVWKEEKPARTIEESVGEESKSGIADHILEVQTIRVLVVDDSSFFARQLKIILEADPNIQVVANAKNGREAVDFLATNPSIDLITLDVQMPVMPGDSTLKHIMIRFGIPVVIISSFHAQSLNDIHEFLQLGAVDFAAKPDMEKDFTAYGERLRDIVKRAACSKVSHFRRWRQPKFDLPLNLDLDQPPERVLLILGAEGAYMDWFRLPLPHLCRKGLVIGLQKLSDSFLPGFCRLLQKRLKSSTAPLMHSEWIAPGTFYLGNGGHRIKLQLMPENMALGIEILSSVPLSWHEGIHSWAGQLAEQAGSRMSIYLLSAVHSFSADFIEHLLRCNVRMILSPLDTVMCTDLVESVVPYARSHTRQIVWGNPENLMKVWLNDDLIE